MTRTPFAVTLLVVACQADPGGPVTFHDDVAPVFDRSCMGCHVEGGIAPFSLETYETAAEWAPLIAGATADRVMPPFLVRDDGTCGTFRHSEWLSDDEVALIGAWADQGAPEGEPAPRNPITREPLEVDHTDQTPEFEPLRAGGPLTEFDEYRCFLVDPGIDEDRFITGYEVRPGNAEIVHHVIGNVVDPQAPSRVSGKTNTEVMADLDAESPDRPGWPCYSQAGDGVRVESDAIGWAPGQGAVLLPEDTGVTLQAGHVMVYQIHYNLVDEDSLGQTDSSSVDLRLAESVDKVLYPLYVDYLLGFGQSLPGGESEATHSRGARLQQLGVDEPVELWGIMPHMHELGRTLQATAVQEGEEVCMARVDHWSFEWQRVYFYEDPVRLDPRDRWQITCTYDTTSRPEGVRAGWGTQNEMCLTVLYLAVAD